MLVSLLITLCVIMVMLFEEDGIISIFFCILVIS